MRQTYYERYLNLLEQMGVSKETFETNIFKGLDPHLAEGIVDAKLFYNAVFNHSSSMANLIALAPPEQAATMLNILMQTYYFWKFDKKVYQLSNRLTSSLMFTNVDNVPSKIIDFPHKSLYISLPNKYFTIKSNETGIHDVSGIFILTQKLENTTHFRILVVGDANKNSKSEDDDCVFFYRIKIKHFRFGANGKKEDVKLSDADCWSKEGQEAFRQDFYEQQLKDTLKFIFNISVWIQTGEIPAKLKSDPVPQILTNNPKKRKRQEKKYGNLSHLKYYELDDPKLEDFFKNELPNGNISERMRHKSKWIVEGHWHLYWTGKGRTIPRNNLLAPYYKGLDRVEAVNEN